jgi:hypothetical protein
MCGAGENTSKVMKRELYWTTSQSRTIREKVGSSSRWPVQKGGEASARQLETFRLGRRSPLLYTVGVVRLRMAVVACPSPKAQEVALPVHRPSRESDWPPVAAQNGSVLVNSGAFSGAAVPLTHQSDQHSRRCSPVHIESFP